MGLVRQAAAGAAFSVQGHRSLSGYGENKVRGSYAKVHTQGNPAPKCLVFVQMTEMDSKSFIQDHSVLMTKGLLFQQGNWFREISHLPRVTQQAGGRAGLRVCPSFFHSSHCL